MELLPVPVMVLDSNFSIITVNKGLLAILGSDGSDLIGRNPSEVMGYRNSYSGKMVEGFFKNPQYPGPNGMTQECSIIAGDGRHLNFRIILKPYTFENIRLVIMIMQDIADEKYRDALERIFFNDMINTASGIYSLLAIVHSSPELFKEMSPRLINLTQGMLDDIESQRDLRLVELGEIQPEREKVNGLDLLRELCDYFEHMEIAEDKSLEISGNARVVVLYTDRRLLRRVLSNMIKNALEASKSDGTVEVCVEELDNKHVRFAVHNAGLIPDEVRKRMYERYYSTKGKGRGWGTYSMKLLTENCLNGKIYFKSSAEDGTTFFAEYPLN